MKGKNILPGLQIISLHRFLQRFSMRHTTQRDYHNHTDTYYNTQFSAAEIHTIRLHSSKRGVLQYFLEAKHHQQLAYIGYQAVNFVCKLQQHFSVGNTDIQKVQWSSSLAYYKQYNQAMLRSLQDFATLHSHTAVWCCFNAIWIAKLS